jgi:integrase
MHHTWRWYGEREHIRADKVIALTKAQRAFPDALQSLSFHDSHKALPAPPPLLPELVSAPPSVPTFGQMLDHGLIGPGRPLILGYHAETGAPLTGSWKDLYSCGIGAQQGAGKTWLLAFLLAQSAAAGGRLIICDLHAGDDESLANRIGALAPAFMMDIASTPMLRKFFNALARKKLAPKSISLIRTVIRQALEQLVEDDVFEYNPCDRAKAPKGEKTTAGKAFTIDQIAALLDAARGERLDVALRICFSFGLRRGEVCGLRWKDIDLDNGLLTINGTLGYVPGSGLLWGEAKTESGQRAFKLPQSLIAALSWHKTRQEAERKTMGERWNAVANDDVDYVFIAVRSGGALNPGQLYKAFKRAAKVIELEDFRLHDLRHSAASFLHVQRAPKKTISVFMGHASTRITDDIYTHLFQDELNEAADQIEQGLEAAFERRRKTGDSGL